MNFNLPNDPFLEEEFSCLFHLFKILPEWPGYGVDTDGYLWSCLVPGPGFGKFKNKWTRLKSNSTSSNGRIIIGLSNGKIQVKKQLHRLIIETFIGPCPEGLETCHNNGNHTDNRLSNLRYGTHKQNMADKIKHGTSVRGDRHPISKLDVKKVREIRLLIQKGEKNLGQIANLFGVDRTIISRIRDKRAWYWVE